MTRRVDFLTSRGFTPQQARAIVRVSRLSDKLREQSEEDPGATSPAADNVITVIGPTGMFLEPDKGGDPETIADIRTWNQRGLRGNASLVYDIGEAADGTKLSGMNTTRRYLPMSRVDFWCSRAAGTDYVDVRNYEFFHEIAESDIDKPVPAEYAAITGEDPRITWAIWGRHPPITGESHAPVGPINGFYYRSSLYGVAGERLDTLSSQWWKYISTPNQTVTGINRVISVESYLDIVEAANPTP